MDKSMYTPLAAAAESGMLEIVRVRYSALTKFLSSLVGVKAILPYQAVVDT